MREKREKKKENENENKIIKSLKILFPRNRNLFTTKKCLKVLINIFRFLREYLVGIFISCKKYYWNTVDLNIELFNGHPCDPCDLNYRVITR